MKNKSLLEKHIKDMQARIASLRESAKPATPSVGLAYLIESDIEQAETTLAARAISSKLQDIAVKVIDMQGKGMMELTMQMKETFGPEFAEKFKSAVSSALAGLMAQVEQTKDTIDNEVIRMERVANGEPADDMAMDGIDMNDTMPDAEADLGDELPGDDMAPDEMADELEGGVDALGGDIDAALADAGVPDEGSAAGRARKESFMSDKTVLEAFADAVKGGAKPTKAAKMVAEKFDIDADDVREIVKEAAKS